MKIEEIKDILGNISNKLCDYCCTKLDEDILVLEEYIKQQEADKLEMAKAIVTCDNVMLEESGYTYFCDTHDHNSCGGCIVNKANKYIKEVEK